MEKVPASQWVQSVSRAMPSPVWNDPGPHKVQSLTAASPVPVWYFPAPQLTQVLAEEAPAVETQSENKHKSSSKT